LPFKVEKDVDIENFLTKYFDGKQIKMDFFKKKICREDGMNHN
jgi:hypothetical protein